jgi:hypothetical protein
MTTQVAASLSLTGSFDPAEVSNLIGLQPARTWRAGDSVGRRPIKRKDDGWVIEIPREDSLDADVQVQKVLAVVEPHLADLFIVAAKYRLVSILSVAVYVDSNDATAPALHFPSDVLGKLDEMGASLDIDLYVL